MRRLEKLADAALVLLLAAIPVGLIAAIIVVAASILYVLTHAKPTKGEETMVSIMMKPADARGKYTVLAGLEPSNRKPLCTIRAKNILAADKALLGILEKALDGLDIDAGGPVDPPVSGVPGGANTAAPAEAESAPEAASAEAESAPEAEPAPDAAPESEATIDGAPADETPDDAEMRPTP